MTRDATKPEPSKLTSCRAFHATYGRLPGADGDREHAALHNWLCDQRLLWRQGTLSTTSFQALSELGMDWDPRGRYWGRGLARLEAMRRREPGPRRFNRGLLTWLELHRDLHSKGTLPPERVEALSRLGLLVPTAMEQRFAIAKPRAAKVARRREGKRVGVREIEWNTHVAQLVAFQSAHGHLLVPNAPPYRDLFARAGRWRRSGRKGALGKDRENQLRAMGFPFSKSDVRWERSFAAQVAFCRSNSHLVLYAVSPLGRWLAEQRSLAEAGKLDPVRAERLDELGAIDLVK